MSELPLEQRSLLRLNPWRARLSGRKGQAERLVERLVFIRNVKGRPGQSFVGGGELVELLRFKWEQQSKQAVIMIQQQEVSGCESLCVCVCVCVCVWVCGCVGEFWHQLYCRGQYQPSYWPRLQQCHYSSTLSER